MLVVLAAALSAQSPADTPRADTARAVRLTDVSVHVTRRPEQLATVPMAAGVVPRSELHRGQPTIGMDEALTVLPGVYVANRNNFSLDQRLSIRGFGSRANFGLRGVRVYLDGVPQTLPDGQGQLTNVDFANLDRVEVLKGASSALYGNASGGALLLETPSPSATPGHVTTRWQGGSFGSSKATAGGSFREGLTSGAVHVSRFATDGFRQHSAAESRQLSTALRTILGGTTVATLRISLADNPRAENPGALTEAETHARFDSAAANNIRRGADKRVTQQIASLRVERPLGQTASLTTTIFGLWRHLDNPLAAPPPGPPSPTAGTWNGIDRRGGGARLEIGAPLGERVRTTIGLDLQAMRDKRENQRSDAGEPTGVILLRQRETVSEVGPFSQLRWQMTPSVTVDAGLRYDAVTFDVQDRFLDDGVDNSAHRRLGSWSGNAGVAVVPMTGLSFYGLLSTAFETPTTTELVGQRSGAAGFNPDLAPQRALNVEVGVRGRRGAVEGTLSAFSATIRDAIVQVREVGGRGYFANAGRQRNRGLEVGAAVSVARGIGLQAAYTYADYRFTRYVLVDGLSADTLTGNRLAGVPRHFLRAGLRLGPVRGATLDLDQQLSSMLFADDANTIAVDGWGLGVTTLRAGWNGRVGSLRVTPFASVFNVGDRRYVGSVTINGAGGRTLEPSPGRTWLTGIELGWPGASGGL